MTAARHICKEGECSQCLTSSRCSPSQEVLGQTQPSVPLLCQDFSAQGWNCWLLGPAHCPHRGDPHQSPCLKWEREEEAPPQPQGRTACSDSRCNPNLLRLSFQQSPSCTMKHRGLCSIQSQHAMHSQSSPAKWVLFSPSHRRAWQRGSDVEQSWSCCRGRQ